MKHAVDHFPGLLNKELQMAIDYLKALMSKVDIRSNSSTNSKSKSAKLCEETKSSTTKNETIGTQNDSQSVQTTTSVCAALLTCADSLKDEPNYYYGDTLLFDSLEKFKNKSRSQNKDESVLKKSLKLETLYKKQNTDVYYVKKIGIPISDRKKNKANKSKLSHMLETKITNMIQTTTQTSIPSIEDGRKLQIKVTLQTQTENLFSRCDAANNTESIDKHITIETQTKQLYLNSSSQTKKILRSVLHCDAEINANFNRKQYVKSIPLQTYDQDEDVKTELLQRLNTRLQTSLIDLSKSQKQLHFFPKYTSEKLHQSNAKKNGKRWLDEILDDYPDTKCSKNLIPYTCHKSLSPRSKKSQFLPEKYYFKQFNNKLTEPQMSKKINFHPYYFNNSSNKLLLLPKDTKICENNNAKNYLKRGCKLLKKEKPGRKVYNRLFFEDDVLGKFYNPKKMISPTRFDRNKKSPLKNNNKCVNLEGISINANVNVSLLDILNTL
ncbi:hypothetical protein FQR65_LT09135 [Abscondita terminalis]|nr:hypothetical protein FQR65_LT09135 [Abscondita terminalis]